MRWGAEEQDVARRRLRVSLPASADTLESIFVVADQVLAWSSKGLFLADVPRSDNTSKVASFSTEPLRKPPVCLRGPRTQDTSHPARECTYLSCLRCSAHKAPAT